MNYKNINSLQIERQYGACDTYDAIVITIWSTKRFPYPPELDYQGPGFLRMY
jgi:hypothetical protein